jgi:hypothetical protein
LIPAQSGAAADGARPYQDTSLDGAEISMENPWITRGVRVTTVIAVYNSEGCVGRCDANCHNARSRDCDCICGGQNHGQHGLAAQDLHVVDRVATPKTSRAAKQAARALQNRRAVSAVSDLFDQEPAP